MEKVPEWARSWCYYFAAMAFITMIAGVTTLFMSRKLGLVTTIISLIAALAQAATGMTLFWMCRSSLAAPDQQSKPQLLTMFG